MARQEFIRGLVSLQPHHKGCVATIGSFDGVHLGHQKILARLKTKAEQLGVPSLVMVFEPQPHEFFAKENAPARLTRLREKVSALFSAGIDRVLCIRFDQAFRGLTADEFIQMVLIDGLDVKHLEIGDDFRFGCDRAGDFTLLTRAGQRHGFTVESAPTFILDGERVSSTRIRGLLEHNEFSQAAKLLGRNYSISGKVMHGMRLGRKLGAPTANVGLGRHRSPVAGVYAVDVSLPCGTVKHGVANVGMRPTVGGIKKPILEVHIFDYSGDLYHQTIKTVFVKKIRDEIEFVSIDSLRVQILIDLKRAREFFEKQALEQ